MEKLVQATSDSTKTSFNLISGCPLSSLFCDIFLGILKVCFGRASTIPSSLWGAADNELTHLEV